MLIVAGTVEGNISPSAAPLALKVVIGLGLGVLFYSYLLLTGRSSSQQGSFLQLQVSLDERRRKLTRDDVKA
jgi:hypothetical protein